MDSSTTVELFNNEGVLITCEIYFTVTVDADPREYGDRTVWETFTQSKITDTIFWMNRQKYQPTKEELRAWDKSINKAIDYALEVA
jgi:hypothetical protein